LAAATFKLLSGRMAGIVHFNLRGKSAQMFQQSSKYLIIDKEFLMKLRKKRMSAGFFIVVTVLVYTILPSLVRASAGQATVDVFGYYFPQGKLPAAFSEIDHLMLSTIDDNARPAPLNGWIRPKRKAAKDYKLVKPKLDGKNLNFTTQAVRGVSYSFEGAFTKLGNFPTDRPEGEVLLKGHLIKMLNGEKVAETDVSFTYTGGD
jgi:hypothetical protein